MVGFIPFGQAGRRRRGWTRVPRLGWNGRRQRGAAAATDPPMCVGPCRAPAGEAAHSYDGVSDCCATMASFPGGGCRDVSGLSSWLLLSQLQMGMEDCGVRALQWAWVIFVSQRWALPLESGSARSCWECWDGASDVPLIVLDLGIRCHRSVSKFRHGSLQNGGRLDASGLCASCTYTVQCTAPPLLALVCGAAEPPPPRPPL